ncbi:hypothetical protein AOC08_03125 [Polynucleobacter paneuropaeus]|uniref:hypothetical protein n=1 Tax=Polynucleobacter paneuropaeus TaxID=2527775 RepID=UPI001BFD59AF|nr:hypothetical protein [Polynucleobacter paneuropaeus]MBT8592491.1 hypothetical protein [Polynucleobacter paneuropaeus]MBT8632860.1 hypothetical protein [Polynucleobacter paneuropaeus]QWD02046.1 hypothetical protein G6726_09040 [Polynucleobacter paneuropaeus]QWD26614.1 hypothetical protein G6686_08580 [Polynucleobacter paneuropaeus]
MKIKPLFGVVLFCRLKRHLQALWRVIGAGMATYLYTLKNRHSQDSDLIAKFDRHKDAKFLDKLRLVTQALEIKAKAVYRRIFENPCVGGSIPPRATKKQIMPCFVRGIFLVGRKMANVVFNIEVL